MRLPTSFKIILDLKPNLLCLAWAAVGLWGCAALAPASDTSQDRFVRIEPDHAVIVVSAPAEADADDDDIARREAACLDAARELQVHLELVTKIKVPIITGTPKQPAVFTFHVGSAPDTDTASLKEQEARWEVQPDAAYFYGDPHPAASSVHNAIYDFLEKQLSITWIAPGDDGIVFHESPTLSLKLGQGRWVPRLMFRKIRQAYRPKSKEEPLPERFKPFPEFWPSREQFNQLAAEDVRWQQRMRMGGQRPGGGHAFTDWWDRFGKDHPDYFALNKYGKREPVPLPQGPLRTKHFVKICPSNPAVAKQIVDDWLPRKASIRYVNTGLNDGVQNFCECDNCRALDVVLPGENPEALPPGDFAYPAGEKYVHLTDRYVHLTNAVAREIRKHRPDAKAVMYAYLTTLHPPRKLKLEPNVVVQIVPYVIPLDKTIAENLLEGWYAAGATQIAFRPNYHFKYHTMPLPIGVEREMFDVFQTAVAHGCISADYDSLMGHWNLTGMADYILARAMANPDQSFEHWESQYCSAFGNAAEDIKAYFRYWRQMVWEGRLKPNLDRLVTAGRYGNFARGLAWSIHNNYIQSYQPQGCDQYYRDEDFDLTDQILQRALKHSLTPREQHLVEQLVIANRHSRLMYEAMNKQGNEGYAGAQKLIAFRTEHRRDMHMGWTGIFYVEDAWGDISNIYLARKLEQYRLPWIQTPLMWRFQIDEHDRGLDERWQSMNWSQTQSWTNIRTGLAWSNPYESDQIALKDKLKTYDGVGWYTTTVPTPTALRGRKIMLYLGALSDSCRVYVNGDFAGEYIASASGITHDPVAIRIDPQIDWHISEQVITIRVKDLGGEGGLLERPWIVSQ